MTGGFLSCATNIPAYHTEEKKNPRYRVHFLCLKDYLHADLTNFLFLVQSGFLFLFLRQIVNTLHIFPKSNGSGGCWYGNISVGFPLLTLIAGAVHLRGNRVHWRHKDKGFRFYLLCRSHAYALQPAFTEYLLLARAEARCRCSAL